MKKIISLTVIFLISSSVYGQNTVNAYKNSVSKMKNTAVEITAAAIPMDQKENYKITPENYHKAVNVQDIANENDKTVEITVEVQKYADQNNSSVKKEAIIIGNSNAIISSKPDKKQVEIKAAAIKQ